MRESVRRLAVAATTVVAVSCATTDKVITPATIDTEDGAGCRESVGQLLVQGAEYQRQLRAGRPAELFDEGQPQPQAERDLRHGFELSLSQRDGRSAKFDLTCRTWVCQLVVRVEGQGGYSYRATGNEQRIERAASGPSYDDVDPATGARLHVSTQWMLLRDPAGREKTKDELDEQARTSRPVPADLAACRTLARQLYEEVEKQRSQALALPDQMEKRFTAGTPNPALAEQTAASILRVLGLPPRPVDDVILCRANLCWVRVPIDRAQMQALREDDRFWSRVDWTFESFVASVSSQGTRSDSHRLVFELSEGPVRTSGRKLLRRLMTDLVSAASKCQALAPARGGVTVAVSLPVPKENESASKIAVAYQGSARDQPYGLCLRGLADARFLETRLPRAVSPHRESHSFLFPPDPAQPPTH